MAEGFSRRRCATEVAEGSNTMNEKGYKYTGYNSVLLENARLLRKNMTRQEKHLWYDFLCTYDIKFYRQRIIDKYIADFYCSKAHLVVEIDGSQHYTDEGIEYDNIRTEVLQQYELEVIRFSNHEIDSNFSGVCESIDNKVKENLLKLYKQL